MMDWSTVQHLDLRYIGRGLKPLRPHAAAFHPHQAIVAVAIGSYIVEFDALTGTKIAAIDVDSPVVGMAYSPTSGRSVIAILEEIGRLQKVQGSSALSAKDEMARLSRHLGSLPVLAKHRINCIRTAIKRNMDVQNFAYGMQVLELLLSKAPPGKQDELRSLIDVCIQRGLSNKSIDPMEDPPQFCAATLSRLSTIGYDICDLCIAKFSALSSPGCIICGMGSIKISDALAVPVPSPFG